VRSLRLAPAATRIELLNPDDLLGETLRRRGVFAWVDTYRVGTSERVRRAEALSDRRNARH
jgi:hypothetical protein